MEARKNIAVGGAQRPILGLTDIILAVWTEKTMIVLLTAVAVGVGVAMAMVAPPVFHAEAIISPKQSQGGGSGGVPSVLSSLGGLGGMVTAQLGIGNTRLERLEIIAKSPQLAERVIEKNGLMERLFPTLPGGKPPTVREAVETLRGSIITVSANPQKNVMHLGANYKDKHVAVDLVRMYLEALNEKIKLDVREDADSNRKYLERQMAATLDPLIREKLQQMIAMEIERAMMVSYTSFDILEAPVPPLSKMSPNKRMMVAVAFLLGLVASVALVFVKRGARDLFRLLREAQACPAPAAATAEARA